MASFSSVRFPNIMGCTHDIEKIREMVKSSQRKGLLTAQSPELIMSDRGGNEHGEVEEHWRVM
jgi:hypothetical protein